MDLRTIRPVDFAEKLKTGANCHVIDVRTPAEFREVHVQGAANVPLDQLDPSAVAGQRGSSDSEPIYVLCRSGSRAKQACTKFTQAGILHAIQVEGGTDACIQAGLPLVRGKKMMSLERQVRIAAGALVLVGVALGWLVHPAFLGLSAFVGAGLIFAGITDTCGMGMMLARMPWNQVADDGKKAQVCDNGNAAAAPAASEVSEAASSCCESQKMGGAA